MTNSKCINQDNSDEKVQKDAHSFAYDRLSDQEETLYLEHILECKYCSELVNKEIELRDDSRIAFDHDMIYKFYKEENWVEVLEKAREIILQGYSLRAIGIQEIVEKAQLQIFIKIKVLTSEAKNSLVINELKKATCVYSEILALIPGVDGKQWIQILTEIVTELLNWDSKCADKLTDEKYAEFKEGLSEFIFKYAKENLEQGSENKIHGLLKLTHKLGYSDLELNEKNIDLRIEREKPEKKTFHLIIDGVEETLKWLGENINVSFPVTSKKVTLFLNDKLIDEFSFEKGVLLKDNISTQNTTKIENIQIEIQQGSFENILKIKPVKK